MMADIPYDNEQILAWNDKTFAAIKNEITALGITHRPKSPSPKALQNSITRKYRMKNGMIDKLSFGMPRSGIFRHKGVGKGTPISRVGQTTRRPARWYSNPVDRNMPALQKIVADNDCTYVVNNLSIK